MFRQANSPCLAWPGNEANTIQIVVGLRNRPSNVTFMRAIWVSTEASALNQREIILDSSRWRYLTPRVSGTWGRQSMKQGAVAIFV